MKYSVLALLILSIGCNTSEISELEPSPVSSVFVDLYDIQQVVESMAPSLLNTKFDLPKPIITLGTIVNDTPYHIDTTMIGELVRDELMKSELVEFSVASGSEQGEYNEILKQLRFQTEASTESDDLLVDPNTAARVGKFAGARFVLVGKIYSLERQAGRHEVESNYQFILNLIEIQTAKLAWSDSLPIQKRVRK